MDNSLKERDEQFFYVIFYKHKGNDNTINWVQENDVF